MMRGRLFCALACMVMGVVLSVPAVSFAERPTEGLGQWLEEVGVSVSHLRADLKYQDDMVAIPLALRFGFDLKPFTKKFGWEPKGHFELVYEPFISPVIDPDANIEFGLTTSFKYAYPLTEKFYPYVLVGTGPYYTSLHTYEQSTQFNFCSQGGGGFMYFFREHWAVSADYRWRHASNAGMKQPNGGVDSAVYTLGLSYYF